MAALSSFTSFDTTPFPLHHWGNAQNPETVLIGIHGFCGAAADFTGLASQLTEQSKSICVYAYNLRGMGLDPVHSRIGDIENVDFWIRDLYALTHTLKCQYPQAKIVYCGESLGALIALHASTSINSNDSCDALIMLSPVVDLSQHLSPVLLKLAHIIASIFPHSRITIESLLGRQDFQATQNSHNHLTQSQTNPWHVPSFTLRFLDSIHSIISTSSTALQNLNPPSLILYGGKDFLTSPQAIEKYLLTAPQSRKPETTYFPEAHHLMLYDAQSVDIFQAIGDWLELSYCQSV